MDKNLPALKPYLDSLKQLCSCLSKEDLMELILSLAKEVPAKQRNGFLETIDRLSRERPPLAADEGILEEIEALKEEIGRRIASIEDGSYHEDHYQEYGDYGRYGRRGSYYYDDYDEGFPDTLSEDQKFQLESFFQEAADLFLSGQLASAREVYAALYRVVENPYDEDDDVDYSVSDYNLDVEMREARARYCRCVYETTPVPERVPAMLDAMNLQARLSGSRFDVHENNHPMFCDVMDCRPGELTERDQFLPEWRQALRGQSSDRADMLLLEAVYLMEGLPGVQSLVRTWGARQPRAWLFWIWLLVKLRLMTGRIEAAFDKARKIRTLGWSYGEDAGAMLFAAVLSLLCLHRIEAAVVIRRVLKRYGDSGHAGHAFDGEPKQATEDRAGRGICSSEETLRGLQKASVSEEQKHRYLSWALETGRKRIEQIVSNKHRGAYDRAAETLGALAECYLLNGEEEKSRSLIDDIQEPEVQSLPGLP